MRVRGVLRDAWLYRADFGRYIAIAAAVLGAIGSFLAYAAPVHRGRRDAGTTGDVAHAQLTAAPEGA